MYGPKALNKEKTKNTLLRKFLLSAAFLLCCTALANAANRDTHEIDGIYYILDNWNNTATVTWSGEDDDNCTEGYSGDIVIPAKVSLYNAEYTVTSIGTGAFNDCSGLTSITIPNSVTSIGDYAFALCENLQSVYVSWEIPLAISQYVFYNTKTSEITLHIPYGTLDAYSTALVWETFVLDGIVLFADANAEAISVAKWDTDHDNLLSTKEAAAVTDLGNVFSGTAITSFNELKYFTGLTGIGANAFKGSSITSIEIPPTITSIGEGAFEECANLKYVTIPATVTSIGDNAFKNCSGLEEIYIKAPSPLSINSNVFENVATTCLLRVPYDSVTSYQEAVVWKDFTNIQDNAIQFKDSEVEAICLANWDTNKDGVLTYEEAATVKIIDYRINTKFSDNSNITSFEELKYFTGLKEIGLYAFSGCTGLTSITIPNNVTIIGARAFNGCTGLTSVTIPNSVTAIGDYTFNDCTNLQNVNINVVDFANNNIIYDYFGTSKTIKYYYNGEEISGELTIPSTTTSIGNNALKGVTELSSVTIPNSVTAIGSGAFYSCTGLETVSVQWTEAENIPDISKKNVFNGITLANVTLDIPYKKGNTRPLYTAKDVWKDFNIVFAKNFIITKSDNTTIEHKASENSEITIDESIDFTKLLAVEDIPSVKSITYTRDFTNVVGKWQTWFVPFEAPVSVLNDAELDVAEIAGILLDEDENTIVAFKKMDGGTMKANTPYVVRLKADAPTIATLVFENTNLKETAESEYYAMSMYDKFTFTGNYESKHIDNSYSMNTDGEFQKMDESVNLKPMRFSLAVTQRDDSPYGSSPKQAAPRPKISFMIMGDEELQQDSEEMPMAKSTTRKISTTPENLQPTVIYDLRGRKVNRIQSKQVYIINGKNYIAR